MTNRFVVADASKCIGCKTCEIACAVSHNHGQLTTMTSAQFVARLKVIKSGAITTPVMCRQCDNAPCASVCPTGAIVRENDSIQVLQDRCIGCKSCALVCPFGAMYVTTKQITPNVVKTQALKCDLCIDNPTGPACVSVCPTKAIKIIYPDNLTNQINDRQQQTAQGQLDAFL
jgi:electron transport protein HydN